MSFLTSIYNMVIGTSVAAVKPQPMCEPVIQELGKCMAAFGEEFYETLGDYAGLEQDVVSSSSYMIPMLAVGTAALASFAAYKYYNRNSEQPIERQSTLHTVYDLDGYNSDEDSDYQEKTTPKNT